MENTESKKELETEAQTQSKALLQERNAYTTQKLANADHPTKEGVKWVWSWGRGTRDMLAALASYPLTCKWT